ncbi:hypothetical cytosolic protein [Syntrophus aciditrophicus SB]|uniref:Hypothetical cytosolic protein n=1 Tax=Syntrophus aciditrophicus (strain SB) TaxID=56780 RepID=Q2LXT6_SYNAS|nr:hypothetical cytosolic protein [Syntrophus aciditrophicus SB]
MRDRQRFGLYPAMPRGRENPMVTNSGNRVIPLMNLFNLMIACFYKKIRNFIPLMVHD